MKLDWQKKYSKEDLHKLIHINIETLHKLVNGEYTCYNCDEFRCPVCEEIIGDHD